MAARLPVVISQSARREPAAVTCEEKLITELLFTAGLDATLVGPLEAVEAGSTDHLCLEGLKGPFALLGWTSLVESQQQLSRLGIHGSIVDRDDKTLARFSIHTTSEHDPNRRIDYYQLRFDRETSAWVDSLKKILEVREVKAFSILLPGKPTVRAAVSEAPSEPKEQPALAIVGDERSKSQPPIFAKTIDPDDQDEAWSHLDDLVDDLDQADV